MKRIANALIMIFMAVILSCSDYFNPYDRECPPERWTPTELKAVLTQGIIDLTWKQSETHFDGYMIEKSTDSITWEEVNSSLIPPVDTTYSDSFLSPGDTMYYRIYGIADLNTSDYAYSNPVDVGNVPEVKTICTASVDQNSAILNGEIVSDNGSPITEAGFYYSTSKITDLSKATKVVVPVTSGNYLKEITGLVRAQTYYVKAFATSNVGTGFGAEGSFCTSYFGSDEEQQFKKYMPVYTGTTTVDINGVYLVSLFTVVNDSHYNGNTGYKPGDTEPDMTMRFRKNIVCGETYDFDSYQDFSATASEMTSASNITFQGSGNNFTCYLLEDGVTFGIPTKKIVIISATKIPSGLKDCYVGIKLMEKGSDPQSLLPPAGTYLVFKDGDNTSQSTSWTPK